MNAHDSYDLLFEDRVDHAAGEASQRGAPCVDVYHRIEKRVEPDRFDTGVQEATEKRTLFNGTRADEREALAACLDRLHLGERQVVRSLTRSGLQVPPDERMLSYLRENLERLEEETLTDFLAKNREQHPVEPDLNPGGRLVCVGDEEFGHIFRDADGWDRLRREFPGSDGTLRFSRVGLDRDVPQAMLYAGQQFDWNVGSGGFWLCSKVDGEWIEAGRVGNGLS
jgi:hypothetical protein